MSTTCPIIHRADEVSAFEVVVIGPLPGDAENPYWLVRWRQPNRSFQEFRCTTEEQAQRFAKLWEIDGRLDAEPPPSSRSAWPVGPGR